MGNAFSIAKFLGAWLFLIAAVVLIVIGKEIYAIPGVLALVSIAFSQAPARWA